MSNFESRYPEIQFLLSFFPHEEALLPTEFPSVFLEGVEVLYSFGLVDAPLPREISLWLAGAKERALIFVEDRLGAFAAYSQEEPLLNPQIHFLYREKIEIEELAHLFPSDRVALIGKEEELLVRRSAAHWAVFSDVVYGHKIARNVIAHFRRLPECFDARGLKGGFTDVPAIICGAGPSLDKVAEELKELRSSTLIIAGGSAIAALSKMGVTPHLSLALDPNQEELSRFKQSTNVSSPLLVAPRLQKEVWGTSMGPFVHLQTDTGGLLETYLERELAIPLDRVGQELGSEAFSVTTLATSVAKFLGCKQIAFVGVDLAFTGGKRYGGGVQGEELVESDPRALEKRVTRDSTYGGTVETLLKWVMEAETLGAFGRGHPDLELINATGAGLGFAGIKNGSLGDLQASYADLDGRIHQRLLSAPMGISREKVEGCIEELARSFSRASEHIGVILKWLEEGVDSPYLVLALSDLEEEPCYRAFLQGVDLALSHLFIRYVPHLDPIEGKRERDKAKYQELLRQIDLMRSLLFEKIPASF